MSETPASEKAVSSWDLQKTPSAKVFYPQSESISKSKPFNQTKISSNCKSGTQQDNKDSKQSLELITRVLMESLSHMTLLTDNLSRTFKAGSTKSSNTEIEMEFKCLLAPRVIFNTQGKLNSKKEKILLKAMAWSFLKFLPKRDSMSMRHSLLSLMR